LEVPVPAALIEIPPQSGVALQLRQGEWLQIVDVYGGQVADLACFAARDTREAFSSGRTIDYNESLRLRVGDLLYSNRSGELARVVEDSVGIHDMLLSPCSEAMFARRGELAHPSCHANLTAALGAYGIVGDAVVATLNVFMDVRVHADGRVEIRPPASMPGDRFAIEAVCDLIVGVAACSSELTNHGRCKAIAYEVRSPEFGFRPRLRRK
jgi:uncharacterized protein YcgI (DUF1989 family)